MARRCLVLVTAVGLFFSVLSCNKLKNPDGSTPSNITITSIRPEHGPFNTIDTITGAGFDQLPGPDSILINGHKVAILSRTPQQIIVQIPSLTGTGNVDIWYQGQKIEGPVFSYDSALWVTTVAGSSTEQGEVDGKGLNARFYDPIGIAVDQSGNIYVAEMGGSSVRKIDTGGNVTSIAGSKTLQMGYADGQGASAQFSAPRGLCMDKNGYLYVADQFNFRVRKVTTSGTVSTFAGGAWDGIPAHGGIDGDAASATFDSPWDVAVDDNGNVYVADVYNNKIRKITPAGVVSTLAGGDYYHSGQKDGQGSSALFLTPMHIACDRAGNVYVSDSENELLRKIKPDGTVTTLLGPKEPAITGEYDLFHVNALATDKFNNLYFAISVGIIKMTPDGRIIRYATGGIGELDGPAISATYRAINGIAVDDAGTLYITDNNRVRKIAWR